jgi:enterochelin esterase-like enzyme
MRQYALKPGLGLLGMLSILGLSACTIASAPVSTCNETGTIGGDRVTTPTQGFEISFQYYLPPCYDETAKTRYPVIYLIAMPYESLLDPTANTPMSLADRLIRGNKMAPAILVVPEGTVAYGYHAALATDLIPHVDNKFNTLDERSYRAVGGISHGAAISARMAFQYSNLFGSLGVFSGGIDGSEKEAFAGWIDSTRADNRPRVLIDVGDTDGILPLTQNLLDVLNARDVPYTMTGGEGGHNWTYWSARMELYLLWFAEAWE